MYYGVKQNISFSSAYQDSRWTYPMESLDLNSWYPVFIILADKDRGPVYYDCMYSRTGLTLSSHGLVVFYPQGYR